MPGSSARPRSPPAEPPQGWVKADLTGPRSLHRQAASKAIDSLPQLQARADTSQIDAKELERMRIVLSKQGRCVNDTSLSHTYIHTGIITALRAEFTLQTCLDCMSVCRLCAEVPMRSNTRVPQFFFGAAEAAMLLRTARVRWRTAELCRAGKTRINEWQLKKKKKSRHTWVCTNTHTHAHTHTAVGEKKSLWSAHRSAYSKSQVLSFQLGGADWCSKIIIQKICQSADIIFPFLLQFPPPGPWIHTWVTHGAHWETQPSQSANTQNMNINMTDEKKTKPKKENWRAVKQ